MKWYEKQKKLYQDMNEKGQDTENTESAQYGEVLVDTETEEKAYEENAEIERSVYEEHTKEREEELKLDNEDNFMDASFATSETNISKDACLTGDLKMEGNLKLSGTIVGNINCTGDVRIDGKVEGDITCANAYFDHAEITGNITCQSYIEILEGTNIQGNVQSSEMQSNGYIVGNVEVHGDIKLSQNAVIEGDVMAQYLESEKGSSLKGQCIISAQD